MHMFLYNQTITVCNEIYPFNVESLIWFKQMEMSSRSCGIMASSCAAVISDNFITALIRVSADSEEDIVGFLANASSKEDTRVRSSECDCCSKRTVSGMRPGSVVLTALVRTCTWSTRDGAASERKLISSSDEWVAQ